MIEKPWLVQSPALVHRMLLETEFSRPDLVRQWARFGLEQGIFIESLPVAQCLLTAPPSKVPELLCRISSFVLDADAFGRIAGHLLEGWVSGEHTFSRVMDGLTWVSAALSSGQLTLAQDLVQLFRAEPYGLTELVQRYAKAKGGAGDMEGLQADVDEFLQGYAG